MFLKKIELAGFKSFPNRTTVDFVPGVTAIVGPNGSGKSNIIDAIRWVLGEQSAKSLRGQTMEDVIFSGSDSKKAVNFAEVSLLLDNESGQFPVDYAEVKVTRRVYRTGESVFRLNGQTCRLKDITNLFIDSGVGKAAFSIISQGRVDEILNAPSKERRLIFDEAAGVLKYKKRKEVAEKKLLQTNDHLDRVLDILIELDERLEPLRLQAEKVKQAERLDQEIRALDYRILQWDFRKQSERLDALQRSYTTLKEEEEALAAQVEEREVERASIRQSLREQSTALERLVQQESDVLTSIERWEGRQLVREEQTKHRTERLEQLNEERQSLESELEDVRKKRQSIGEEIATLVRTMEEQTERYDALRDTFEQSSESLEEAIERDKSIYIDALNEEATLRNDLSYIEKEIERLYRETVVDDDAAIGRQKEFATARETLEQCRTSLHTLQQRVETIEEERLTVEREHVRHEQEATAHERSIQKAESIARETKSNYDMLVRLERSYTGFYSGVKAVLQGREKGKLQGIEGAVSQLLTTDARYTQAIEVALGSASQQIVTRDERAAKEAIRYLRTEKLGRATFLPLTVIRGRRLNESVRLRVERDDAYCGIAADLVTCDESYRSIAEQLLGRTIVVRSLDDATRLARSVQYSARFVTLQGDVVNAGGSMTGGGRRNETTPFGQKAEKERLYATLQQMTARLEQERTKMEELRTTVHTSLERMLRIQAKKKEVEEQLQTLALEERTLDEKVRNLRIAYEAEQFQKKDDLARLDELKEERQRTERSLAQKEESLEQLRASIEERTHFLANRREEEQSMREEMHELDKQLHVMREQLNALRAREEEEEKTSQRLQNRLHQLSTEESALLENETYTEEEIQSTLEQERKRAVDIREQIRNCRADVKRLEALEEETERTLLELRRTLDERTNDVTNVRIEQTKASDRHSRLKKQLIERHGTDTVDLLVEAYGEEEPHQLAKWRVERKAIGPVRKESIAEYEEVAERHAFLSTQRNDLIEAKVTLEMTMEEMDEEMTERFETTFHEIRHQFQRVFVEMFGGGEADLQLTDPDDLLETGVDLYARPPGKKLQPLSLLSGGERALTAITLLFAMIEVRPVPFCILDEVEAALDEVNVGRFSRYLKQSAADTQFIVITHRKGTMEGADVLYGVTMEQAGVSKLLSVQLSNVEEQVGPLEQ